MNRKLSLVCLLLGASACDTKPAASPDAALPPDAARCTSDNTCTTAGLGVCDTGSGTCVQCTASNDTACDGATPVCGTEQTCRACAAHSECDSDVCLPTGACAVASEVAYVDGAAPPANTACTQAAPCKTITAALAATPIKATIKIKGTINDQVAITRSVSLLAEPGAELTSTSNGTLVTITGSNTVAIADLKLRDASGTSLGYGILVPPANAPTVTLSRVVVDNCGATGISASGGTLTVTGSTISGNETTGISASGGTLTVTGSTISGNETTGISASGGTLTVTGSTISGNETTGISASGGTLTVTGSTISGNETTGISASGGTLTVTGSTISGNETTGISASGGTLTVTGSTISGNETTGISASGGTLTVTGSTISGNLNEGGISISAADFTLVNNFIIHNGLATASKPGLELTVSNGKTGRVEFNTIASNLANTPVTAGVFCTNNGNFTFANNIVAGNAMTTGGATNTNQQVGCPTTNNTLLGDLTNLKFQNTNPAAPDYKLTTGSVAIDKGTVSTAAPTDFFGTARPKGAAPDHGAHEF